MANWNTSSTNRSAFERILGDPKKLSAVLVGTAAVLLTLWALAFKESPPDPEAQAVAFSAPDPSRALPPVGSGMLPSKLVASAKADPEADALKSLQAEALKEAAGPADDIPEEDEAADEPYEAEDETGAPGGPIAEGAAFLAGGSGGGFSGSLGGSGGGSYGDGGLPAGAAGLQASAGAAGGGAAAQERTLQGAAGTARGVSGGGRAMRSGSAGSTLSGAASGMGRGSDRFAPGGSSGSSFNTGTGGGITTAGGGNAYAGGAGGGVGQDGGGGVTDRPGGNPDFPGGGGGGNPGGGSDGGGAAPVTAKKRSEIKKDAKGVLKTATDYRRGVVAKIMVEERADLQALSQRSLQAHRELKAGQALLAKDEGKFAAFPQAAQNLSETRALMSEQFEKFREGGTTLKKALKTLTKVPPQCRPKTDAVAVGGDGLADDPAGVLQAHRDALQALRRIAVARVAVDEAARAFREDAAADEPAIRAADPKLADEYVKLSKKVQKDLDDAGKLIPASLYPLKGKGKAAKKDLAKKLKPVKKAAEKGAAEARRRASEIKAAHRAYPQTADLQPTEDAAWAGSEAAHRVVADDPEAGGPLLTQAAVFLPPLVKAGEYASESYLQQCDAHAGLLKLAKDAPK